jgi:hypothetical protein
MAGHLYWQSANFTITAFIDSAPRQVRVIARGDFAGSGSAVLRGALTRLSALLAPIRFNAAGVTGLSADAVTALTECAAGSGRLVLEAVPDRLDGAFGAATLALPDASVPALRRTA